MKHLSCLVLTSLRQFNLKPLLAVRAFVGHDIATRPAVALAVVDLSRLAVDAFFPRLAWVGSYTICRHCLILPLTRWK
jgi:hypothetical protein